MEKRSWNICMIGSAGVGKTSLVKRYVENTFTKDFNPTMGVHLTKRAIETERYRATLMLWDLAGDDEIFWSKDLVKTGRFQDVHTARANAYILVADVSRRSTLKEAILRQERISRDRSSKNLQQVPFILALNKSDLSEKEFDEGEARRTVGGWQIVPTSAKTGDGVTYIFETIADTLWGESVNQMDGLQG